VITGFQLRAPWYERERVGLDLVDPPARRPVLQMYDGTDFVRRLIKDPGDSLDFGVDDRWSYPVPVTPSITAKGRDRFATSKLVHTGLRKLYQPSHSRFYAVVVEVFCDSPGLPRAGSHSDIEVCFVMRRQHTAMVDCHAVRRLAKKLMKELAREEHGDIATGLPDLDVNDLWWASEAERARFEADNSTLIEQLDACTSEEAWVKGTAGGRWQTVDDLDGEVHLADGEETFPMWRLPPRDEDCEAAKTRSLWFGLIPTYSAEHWVDGDGSVQTKLDDREIYHLRCVVTQPPPEGHEHCPPHRDISVATAPFRLAAPYDPDGTKNHTVSITAPDLRRLAAKAGQKQGPGGLRIMSPPKSALSPVDFKKIPGAKLGAPGGGSICTFAFELFFIVALFLFLLFLPIILLAFQLWFLLALRFCIPPSASFRLLGEFFAQGHVLVDLKAGGAFPRMSERLDEVIGVHDAATQLTSDPTSDFAIQPNKIVDLVAAADPKDAVLTPVEPALLTTPPDPLCPSQ
jgi:hypothetical protein